MPHRPNHRKVKRATLLTKRTQYLKSFPKTKFYKPSYWKLKSNNSSLAKALSKEKEENQLLFTRNVALVAELQDLGQACSKRDTVISDVLRNAKEILKMIVTMSSYVTNTISSCQEFASSANTDLMRLSCNSIENRNSYRRLSTKSPARGVVKPMVSGHTITKPTINLSRVNMQRINPSNLSTILETPPSPEQNREINEIRAPVSNVSLNRQIRYVNNSIQAVSRQENRRAPRMPERLIISSSRSNEEDERRLSKRSNRRSARMSGRHSRPKSGRLSGNHVPRFSLEHMSNVGSPRVKLNDVSKLLQNSHSVNVRTLAENRSSTWANESQQSNDETSVDNTSAENIVIAETRMDSADTEEEEDQGSRALNATKETDESGNEESRDSATPKFRETSRTLQSSWEDPLEGPSWLFNSDEPEISARTKSSIKKHSKANITPNELQLDGSRDSMNSSLETSLPNVLMNSGETDEVDKSLVNEQLSENLDESDAVGETGFAAALQINVNTDKRNCVESRRGNETPMNFSRFVTCSRSKSFDDEDEDIDDFTLMYLKQPNMSFDINDLRLPVLEDPIIPPSNIDEPEPEITATLQRITQNIPLPTVSNAVDDSIFEQSIAMRLPSLANEHNVDVTPINRRSVVKRKRGFRKENLPHLRDITESSLLNTSATKQKKRSSNDKDPSAVKVVLQKLQESFVQHRSPSQDDIHGRESHRLLRKCTLSPRTDNCSDSDSSSISINSRTTQNRPKRRKAPMNLQEPKLNTKLRRRV